MKRKLVIIIVVVIVIVAALALYNARIQQAEFNKHEVPLIEEKIEQRQEEMMENPEQDITYIL